MRTPTGDHSGRRLGQRPTDNSELKLGWIGADDSWTEVSGGGVPTYDVDLRQNTYTARYHVTDDDRSWLDPDTFRPERFVGWIGDPYSLIPQGAGDVATTHRCPGEALTIELMKTATRLLSRTLAYDVPPQDLSMSLSRIPALPASRFVVERVRLAT